MAFKDGFIFVFLTNNYFLCVRLWFLVRLFWNTFRVESGWIMASPNVVRKEGFIFIPCFAYMYVQLHTVLWIIMY